MLNIFIVDKVGLLTVNYSLETVLFSSSLAVKPGLTDVNNSLRMLI